MTDMDNGRTPTCLLCNNYFDQKPHLSQGEEADRDGEYFADFKKAFQLFCKLIKVVRNEGREYVFEKEGISHGGKEELNGFAPELDHLRKGHHPCCGDCNMALLDLLRCDKIIKEAEARKQEVLESLKMAIVENHDMHKCQLDEVWLPVRAKLVQSLEETRINPNSDEADIQIAQAVTNDGDYSKDIDDDDSSLQGPQYESFDSNYVLPDLQDPEIITVESSPLLPDPLREELPMKRRRDRIRKKVLDSRVIQNKEVKRSSIKTKPCSISLTRIRVEDCPSDLKIDLKIPSKEPQTFRERLKKVNQASETCHRQSSGPRGKGDGVNYKNVFYLINEDILLFQNTSIKFNPSGFTCLEPDCSHFVDGSDYFTFQGMRAHINESHGEKFEDKIIRRPCPLCDKTFADGNSIRNHIFEKHAPGRVSTSCTVICESCLRPIKNYTTMGKHVWLHMSEEERAVVKAEGRYRDHFAIRTVEDSKIFSCKSCPKQFLKLTYLRTHEKVHVPKHLRPKYNCDECGLQFLNRKSLQDHIEHKHKPELVSKRNLKCRICGREFNFRRGTTFRTHMRSHTGETPFVCEICGKGFISSTTLKVHSKSVHVTDRPFQCEYCDKSYKLNYLLKLHQKRAHKGLLPQTDAEDKLKYVPMQYRQGVIGPVQMFPCEHCDKVLAFRSRLKYHMKISHPEVFQSAWLS